MAGKKKKPVLSLWHLLLSHHRAGDLHHCYHLRFRKKNLYLCSRCLGLYPTLAVTLALSGFLTVSFEWACHAMFLMCGVTLVDWAVVRLRFWKGNNYVRTTTGAIAGAGLGLALPGYFRKPWSIEFWTVIVGLAFVAFLVELVAQGVE
jgi:uncharacterized membrane protein